MALAWMSLASGCTADYQKDLPSGYRLRRSSSALIYIHDNEARVVVTPRVDRYRVVGRVITGYVSEVIEPVQVQSVPGYFIIDTATHRISNGLDEEAWRARLREFGIARPPHLWPTDGWVWDANRPWHEWARRQARAGTVRPPGREVSPPRDDGA